MTALFDPLRLAEVGWDVACTNTASFEQVQQRQRARLTDLLAAARAAPLYRKHLAGRDLDTVALLDLPVVHKQIGRAHV